MDTQTTTAIKDLFTTIIERDVNPDTYKWLCDKAGQASDNYQLNIGFTAIPRKTGKKEVAIEESEVNKIADLLPGFSISQWSIDRLSRVWLLMQLESGNKENYIGKIENLFPQGEMNELVALYSSLPFFAYPESWQLRCAEGIRSNIGTVLEAIMYHNPYPAAYLDEPAWNQLIMKAFFTDKDVNDITGLDKRSNQNLANMLFDYVEERWAAHRKADPQIWRLVAPFMDEPHFYMLQKLFKEGDGIEHQAAALACAYTHFEKAKELLNEQHPGYKNAINNKTLSWEILANNITFLKNKIN
jgi:hypothetical protein